MNEQKNYNGRGIFYGVIGVATLVVAIIGATFAYFTASASNENVIQGNMATIEMGLVVTRVVNPGETTGMIPMSNNMVEAAVGANTVCVDDNGNAVCQIYKAVITNESTAGVFVDGYVALRKGSGTPTDYMTSGDSPTVKGTKNPTTMRWAQVFESGGKYSTAGTQNLGTVGSVTLTAIGGDATKADPHNASNIRDEFKTFDSAMLDAKSSSELGSNDIFVTGSGVNISLDAEKGVLTKKAISGSNYAVIGKNYIRVSNHTFGDALSADEVYKQADDVTSALVYNQQLDGTTKKDGTVSQTYYFVVWLSETGANQTAGETGASESAGNFFDGQVKFISAQGSEVSATFGGYTRVPATYTTTPAA